jgi:UDP-glucose 4-epimerase
VRDNLTTGFDWAVPPGASFVIGDAGDQSQVPALIAEYRVDVIIIFTFPIPSPPTPMRLLICAVAASPRRSIVVMAEVFPCWTRSNPWSVDFKVEFAARQAGNPPHLVAAYDRIRSTLKWQPRYDDLQTIVTHALA